MDAGAVTMSELCPYCGESIDLLVDTSVGEQSYVEDCQVCCRPIVVVVGIDADCSVSLTLRREDEA